MCFYLRQDGHYPDWAWRRKRMGWRIYLQSIRWSMVQYKICYWKYLKDKRIVLLFPVGTYPHSEEQQLQFPLLDMLKANMEYKEDDYASFMQQYNLPERFRSFIKKILRKSCLLKSIIFLMGISIRTHSVRIWFAVLSFPIISARKTVGLGNNHYQNDYSWRYFRGEKACWFLA